MIKKFFGCWLLLGLAISLLFASPINAAARHHRRGGKSHTRSRSRNSSRSRSSRSSRSRVARSRRGGRVVAGRRHHGRLASRHQHSRYARVTRYNNRASERVVSAPPPRASHSVGGLPASAIPPERVREIQDALKREGYLQNEPSGQYDRATVEAMTNYQKDHNFRTTGYPTAESLQKLGLTRQRRVNPPAAPDSVKSEDNSSAPDTQTPHDPGN